MNKLRAGYLQAMGIDLYVQRSQADSAQELLSSAGNPDEELDKSADKNAHKEVVEEAILETEEAPVIEISARTSFKEPDSQEPAPEEKVSISETSPESPSAALDSAIEPASELASPPAEPLYFLWHQVGELLFLTAASQKQTAEQTKLLGAIVGSLSRTEKVERGTGNWPLVGSQPSSANEAQDFLASFVAGRGEQFGGAMTLVLFGEESQKQFVEIEGKFEDILGSKIPSQSDLKEFRLVPALAEMLEKPYLKSIAWQSLRDLRSS